MASRSGQMRLPEVWQPELVVRELRRCFAMYKLLNMQIRQLKNQIHAVLLDNGIQDRVQGTRIVESPLKAEAVLKGMELSVASLICIRASLVLLASLDEQKKTLRRQICHVGRAFESQVKLLISIRGVTPLLALAFLAEVGDIKRFSGARKLHSYLGVVPTVRSSGGVTRNGAINRRSRGLARCLFAQAIIHIVDSSPVLERFYRQTSAAKGYGRARIAVLRKTFSLMRRMLLDNEIYRWVEPRLHEKKLDDYHKELTSGQIQTAA
jgi:transposase